MMNELNKKLAEWAGFIPIALDGYSPFWKDPDYRNIDDIPNFTEFLDACFKWLVPKVSKANEIRITIPPNTVKRFIVGIGHQDNVEAETLSLGLCLAIEKLIDGEK